MGRQLRRTGAVAAATSLALMGLSAPSAAAEPFAAGACGVVDELYSLANQHASSSTAIRSSNADSLKLAYKVNTRGMTTHAALLWEGMVFTADWAGWVYAADAETGELIWEKQFEKPMTEWPWHGFAGTGTIVDGTLYEASVEGNLFAIDARTGQLEWQKRITDQPHAGNLAVPQYYDGLLYIGLQSVDEPLDAMKPDFEPSFQGHVKAYRADTGELVWDTQLVENPMNGVAVWGSFALDLNLGLLYFTTGNNYTGEASPLSDSVIAVDAKTGKIVWSFQAQSHDVWTPANPEGPDYDFGAGPQLFEARIGGQTRMLLGVGNKNGFYYAFDAATGKVMWQTVIGYGGVGGGIRWEGSVGDGTVFVSSNNSWDDVGGGQPPDPSKAPITVKALDASTGAHRWTMDQTQPAVGISTGFLSEDVYLMGSLDGTVKGYRASDGKVVTSFQIPAGAGSALLVEGDTLFVAAGVPATFGGLPDNNALYAYKIDMAGADAGTRVAGADRIGTAAAVSSATFADASAVDTAVLASSEGVADALAGTPLAAKMGGPLLLTPGGELAPAAAVELQRLLTPGDTVHLVGGPAALSPKVADAVAALGFEVHRIAGQSRYGTAVAVAQMLGSPSTVLLATGTAFPDALSAAAAAAEAGGAVLLTAGDRVPAETAAYLAAHPAAQLTAVGGPAARAVPRARAVFGADRCATSAAVAEAFFDAPSAVGLASAVDFPDALVGGVHAAAQGAPVLLVAPTALPERVDRFLTGNAGSISRVFLYGGPRAVRESVLETARADIS